MDTLFITTDDLKLVTTIQKNVQTDTLTPFMEPAQQMYVYKILGEPPYVALMDDINANGITGVTSAHTTLLTYIKPAICWASLYVSLPFTRAGLTNKGLQERLSDEAKAAQDKVYEDIEDRSRQLMEHYNGLLLRFLRRNATTYGWVEEYFNNEEKNYNAKYKNGAGSSFIGGVVFNRDPQSKNGKLDG